MTNEPDLIEASGNEGLPVQDRIGLLRAALVTPPLNGVTDYTRAYTQAIHDLKMLVGRVRGTVDLYDAARERGTSDETLQRGANLILSKTECLVKAWRRGGHAEYQRVLREQRKTYSVIG